MAAVKEKVLLCSEAISSESAISCQEIATLHSRNTAISHAVPPLAMTGESIATLHSRIMKFSQAVPPLAMTAILS
jgi:hypothetical protein